MEKRESRQQLPHGQKRTELSRTDETRKVKRDKGFGGKNYLYTTSLHMVVPDLWHLFHGKA